MKKSFKKNSILDHQMYGTTLLGARGQLVIPADARADLNLQPGDRILVVGRMHKMLGLIKADELSDFVETIMKRIMSKDIDQKIKRQLLKNLNQFKKSHSVIKD